MEKNTNLIKFLLRAKLATYAGDGPAIAPWRPQSHDLRYEEDGLLYLDTYLGEPRFIGEEAVWQDGKPVWSMNYCGRVLSEGFDSDFLKEALRNGTVEMPLRGPVRFVRGESVYTFGMEGTLDWFHGWEAIERNGDVVYECMFHGGIIE